MSKLTKAQLELLAEVAAKRTYDGEPVFLMRPMSEYWYDARPDNKKIDRLIARGMLAEHKPGFISITDAGRAALGRP